MRDIIKGECSDDPLAAILKLVVGLRPPIVVAAVDQAVHVLRSLHLIHYAPMRQNSFL